MTKIFVTIYFPTLFPVLLSSSNVLEFSVLLGLLGLLAVYSEQDLKAGLGFFVLCGFFFFFY